MPKLVIYRVAALMAEELGLPDDWLNDAVKGLLPDRSPPIEGSTSFTTPGLHVGVASAAYLFAMKAQAARQESDGDDLRVLAQELELNSVEAALDLVEQFYDPLRLSSKTALLLEDIISAHVASRAKKGPPGPSPRR